MLHKFFISFAVFLLPGCSFISDSLGEESEPRPCAVLPEQAIPNGEFLVEGPFCAVDGARPIFPGDTAEQSLRASIARGDLEWTKRIWKVKGYTVTKSWIREEEDFSCRMDSKFTMRIQYNEQMKEAFSENVTWTPEGCSLAISDRRENPSTVTSLEVNAENLGLDLANQAYQSSLRWKVKKISGGYRVSLTDEARGWELQKCSDGSGKIYYDLHRVPYGAPGEFSDVVVNDGNPYMRIWGSSVRGELTSETAEKVEIFSDDPTCSATTPAVYSHADFESGNVLTPRTEAETTASFYGRIKGYDGTYSECTLLGTVTIDRIAPTATCSASGDACALSLPNDFPAEGFSGGVFQFSALDAYANKEAPLFNLTAGPSDNSGSELTIQHALPLVQNQYGGTTNCYGANLYDSDWQEGVPTLGDLMRASDTNEHRICLRITDRAGNMLALSYNGTVRVQR